MEKPGLIVVAGPTASGKTACAVELCRLIDGEVVSADSMQIYRGMDVLSAMPTAEEMHGIPHHMLGIASPSEKYSASMYREEANGIIADIHVLNLVKIHLHRICLFSWSVHFIFLQTPIYNNIIYTL